VNADSIEELQDGLLLALLQQSQSFLQSLWRLAQQYFLVAQGQGHNQRPHKNQQQVVLAIILQKQADRFKVGMKALLAMPPLLSKSRRQMLHLADKQAA
jgi:hypothetical protein